jgi:hypothetical protein
MKKELKLNMVKPPAMEADRWSSPTLERNTRSANIMIESEVWETTMGKAMERSLCSVVLFGLFIGRS